MTVKKIFRDFLYLTWVPVVVIDKVHGKIEKYTLPRGENARGTK